jgi:hypothetical protein
VRNVTARGLRRSLPSRSSPAGCSIIPSRRGSGAPAAHRTRTLGGLDRGCGSEGLGSADAERRIYLRRS